MNKALQHITLTTGHTRRSPRSEVSDHVIDRLSPVVDAGGGLLGVGDWRMDIKFRGDGYAIWQIGSDSRPEDPWVSCTTWWNPATSLFAWRDLVVSNTEKHGFPSVPAPKVGMPWLAVYLMPGMLSIPLDEITALGDAERCIAWTIIERDAYFHSH